MPQKEKDHFHLPFLNQMLERLARHEYYYFLDEYSGYTQIPIAPQGQEKTTFCPFETFIYRHMPFRLCYAPVMFQRPMLIFFSDIWRHFPSFWKSSQMIFQFFGSLRG